jgi:toxin ParE1/3/4
LASAVRRVELSRRARRDLNEIWFSTFKRWGDAQADAYLRMIDKAVERLAVKPDLGLDFSHVRPGYRRLSVQRHRIFYVIGADLVDIRRVLHERMDVEGHLSNDQD